MLINLILWEKQNGYKAKWVAKQLNCDEAKYSRIKNGKQIADVDLLLRFNEIFGNTIPDGDILNLFVSADKN